MTLTFDRGGHGACSWYRSSSSIRVPSSNVVGFATQKIWHTMCVSINGTLVTMTFDCLPLKLVRMWVSSKVGNLPSKVGHAGPLALELFAMYATDGQTDKSNTYCPVTTGVGAYILFVFFSYCCLLGVLNWWTDDDE